MYFVSYWNFEWGAGSWKQCISYRFWTTCVFLFGNTSNMYQLLKNYISMIYWYFLLEVKPKIPSNRFHWRSWSARKIVWTDEIINGMWNVNISYWIEFIGIYISKSTNTCANRKILFRHEKFSRRNVNNSFEVLTFLRSTVNL